jgi:HKD family nuclease
MSPQLMRISFLRPIDQFHGSDRLMDRLKGHLRNGAFSSLRLAVAFARVGPLLRLLDLFRAWREGGKSTEAIVGIDQLGTSKQALAFMLEQFDKTYIAHTRASTTFHPKFYLFSGERHSVCIFGSHNLTVGGMETNLEGGVEVELDRPEDDAAFQAAMSCWTSLLPESCAMTRMLDPDLLDKLLRADLIFDEDVKRTRLANVEGGKADSDLTSGLFPFVVPMPPSAIPRSVFSGVTPARPAGRGPLRRKKKARPQTLSTEALVMQIVPHHNGEVFLSKIAVNDNPRFFGYPFSGRTVPKKAGNPSYPQREPDPIVKISVFGRRKQPTVTKENYGLNMVYYERKSEIRITLSPDLIRQIAPFSVMVMRLSEGAHDYELEIFNPESPFHEKFLAICNKIMPSGGAERSRKYGWL